MKHCECANYLSLDCEKGMCALDKTIVPIDGEGSDACPRFKEGFLCKNCAHFTDAAAAVRKTGMTPAVLTDHEDKVAFDFFQAKLQAKSMASIDRELATKETELLQGKKVGYVFIDAKTLLESVKSGNVTNAAQFFQIHAPRTLRTTEILLDEQGVAVSFRAPMAVQDETGKSMLEEKKSK